MTNIQFATINVPTKPFSESHLHKGLYICLLHAKRVPPHIGLIINGQYHSLTIKGAEPNVSLKALLKTIELKRIESIFFKIEMHPVFSTDYLNSVFLEILKKHPHIVSNQVTCLTPLKAFFIEFYALEAVENDMIYTFLKQLVNNNFILEAYSLNLALQNNQIEIPVYSQNELNEKIKTIREEYYKD